MTAEKKGTRHQVAIVGGGPAGLSAALWLGRMLHDVVLIDSGDPRNWETRGIHGFLGSPSATPAELRATGRDSCRGYGVELIDAVAERAVRHADDHFELTLEGGRSVHAERVLLAFGLRDVWPELPGLERAYGSLVHTCPLCDGYDVRGRRAVVVGTGRRAVYLALELATWTDDIVVCTLGAPDDIDDEARAKLQGIAIDICHAAARALQVAPDGGGGWLELADGERLHFDHLFIGMGQTPSDDLAAQLGCRRDANDRVVVDALQQTSVANVFAAGDLTPGAQLAIKAAGEGASAALAIHKTLLPEVCRLKD